MDVSVNKNIDILQDIWGEVIGLESLVSSGKCILEGIKDIQITDI